MGLKKRRFPSKIDNYMNSNEDPAFSRRPAQAALSFSNFVCVCVFVFVCVHVSVSLSLSLSLSMPVLVREGHFFMSEVHLYQR